MTTNKEIRKDLSSSPWKSEKLYHCGESFFDGVFQDFRTAENSIFLEIHFIDDHRLGRLFFREVLAALKRGVNVFVIIDGFSLSSKKFKTWMSLYKKYGGQLSFFHPPPWRIRSFIGLFKLNKRNHKKVILIDKKIAYLGSYNIDTRQMSREFGGEGWRDIGIRVEGPSLVTIVNGFYDSWKYCRHLRFKQFNHYVSTSVIRLNHKKEWRQNYFKDLVERMNQARDKIWISNPYFVPDFKILKALERAQERGIDVKIMTPQKSDLKLFPLINSIFYRDLIKTGVKLYHYRPSILHAKVMIIDDWMMMGSSNLNSRTQKHDWEVDVLLTQEDSKKELLQRFHEDLQCSTLVTYEATVQRHRRQMIYLPFLRAVKYFL